MKINSNIQAMITGNLLRANEEKLSNSTKRLSSGFKINNAKDNPAGIAITNKMNSKIKGLSRAQQNTTNGIGITQVAEGAISEIQNMLQRMNELAVKAKNGINTEQDRKAINDEVSALSSEISRIAKDTTFNGQHLIDGSQDLKAYTNNQNVHVQSYTDSFKDGKYELEYKTDEDGNINILNSNFANSTIDIQDNKIKVTNGDGGALILDVEKNTSGKAEIEIKHLGGMKIQVGDEEGQEIQLIIPNMNLKNLGIDNLDFSSDEAIGKSMDRVTKALDYISSARSKLGAFQNRFEATLSNLGVMTENLTNSYSAIKDLDMAEEMVTYTSMQVLVQAGTSMLAQANEQPAMALQLLQ